MADDDDDKKGAETPPVVDPPTDPPTPPAPPAGHEDHTVRDAVARLEETVAGLAAQVASLTTVPGDEKPTNRPWTHRGSL